jgi:gliding motility-associated-like protein
MKINLTLFIAFLIHLSVFSQWVQTAGPNGGYTSEIVQVGTELILSAGNGGIYKSVDNGETWKLSVSGLPCNKSVLALVEYNGLIYASISRSGIYFSNDTGNNWVALNTGIENLNFYSLFVDDSNIYAGNANGGVYYSPDNGITWNDKSNGIDNIQFQDFMLFNSKVYAAGTSLFETSDNGDTWVEVNIPGLSANGIRAMTAENNIFYASSEGTVFTSTDNLNSWNTYTINNNGASIVSMSYSNNSVYLTTSLGRYFYTNDSGVNWSLVQNPNTNSFVHHLFFTNNSILMSTTDGVYESINTGATWSRSNNGLRALQTKSLEKNNLYIFAGTYSQGVFRSADNGENWTLINNGLNNLNSLHIDEIFAIGNTVFIATGDGIYKSTNNGDSWERKLNPGINKSSQGLDSDNGVFATSVSGTGVYISTDNGETWNLTSTNGLNIDTSYYSVKIRDNVIVVSTQGGEMFISTDLGNIWNDISITSSFHLTYDFEFINNNLYAATTKGLMVSSDLGQNWSSFNNDQKVILDVVFDGEKIYIGTNLGTYIATNQEKVWYALCDGMGKQYTNKLLINDNILFAGTYGYSVWKRYKINGDLPPSEDSSTIGIDKLSLCSNSGLVNLYTEIGISSDSNGVWTPNLTSPNGIFNPLVDSPGIYTFTYDVDLCGCENYLKIEISLDGQANAGNDTNLTLCEENISINLFENLDGNPDLNGTWSPQLASGTNIFNPSIDVEGIYTYSVSSVDCGTDTSELDVKVIDIPNAGIDSNLTLCEENISINLFENIDGNPDLGGIWSPQLASGTNIFNPSIDVEGIYTYTIDNGSCQLASELSITIVEEPNAGIDSSLIICKKDTSINLYENINGDPDLGGIWSPQLASGTNTFNPSIDDEGIYTYTIDNGFCQSVSELNITIVERSNIVIDYTIDIVDFSNSNSITVIVNSVLQFEYSLDGILFQTDNFFNNLNGGMYTVFGREIEGCDYFKKEIFILDYPRFFTPNNDGYNDVWQIMGISNEKYNLYIFNRFGKLLKILDSINDNWDGIYNGSKMPSTDYWFKIVLEDGTSKVGHFSLIR